MHKSIMDKYLSTFASPTCSDAFNTAVDIFVNGYGDIQTSNYDNLFLFVEDVYCALENPTTMTLSDKDGEVIECMNHIAYDLTYEVTLF